MKNKLKKFIIFILSLLVLMNISACGFGSKPKEAAVEYDESGRIVKEPGGTFAGGWYTYEYSEGDKISTRYEYHPLTKDICSVTEYFYDEGKLSYTEENNEDGAYWYTEYHENGKEKVVKCFSNGKPDSDEYYNEKGEHIRSTEYKDGLLYVDLYFAPELSNENEIFITRDDRFDENGNIKSSSRMFYDENGNFRTESYDTDPNIDGLYLKDVTIRMNKNWQSPTLEEIRYHYDGSIEYHFKYIYENGELIEKVKVDE